MSPDVLRWVGADSFVTTPVGAAPSILRFACDDFMDRILELLSQRPQDLPQLRAKPEGWQAPAPPTPKLVDPDTDRRPRAARDLARRRSLLGFQRQPAAVSGVTPNDPPLKLFQPIHQRFYLAAAHLVCEQPGLPPRLLQTRDRSAFVIRRIFADASQGPSVEHGFVKGADNRGVWVPLANAAEALAPGENLLPVFPLGYAPPNGPTRSLIAGLIPVSQHDEYVFAARVEAAPDAGAGQLAGPSVADELKVLALSKIITPWQALLTTATKAVAAASPEIPEDAPWKDDEPTSAAVKPRLTEVNNQLVESSWRVLQDFREWLQSALPNVVAALDGAAILDPTLEKGALVLLGILEKTTWETRPSPLDAGVPAFATSLREALLEIGPAPGPLGGTASQWFEMLDDQERDFPAGTWPGFAFPLVLATLDGTSPSRQWPLGANAAGVGALLPTIPANDPTLDALLDQHNPRLIRLLVAMHQAVDEALANGRLPTRCAQSSSAAQLAKALASAPGQSLGPAQFVLRFVHLRCDCGPLAPPVISAPSDVFQLAGFFDPDAPLRPLRIALPFDTTPGGLRKYTKNGSFIISDVLCGQMKRVRALGLGDLVLSVLPWPFYKKLNVAEEGPCGGATPFGMICSLSIPIITIVAFVLLMVMTIVLDIIFKWLPFLMVCFPVPGLRGKKAHG